MGIALDCAEISAPRSTITRTWGGKCAPVPDVIFDDAPEVATLVEMLVPRVLRVDPWVEPTGLDLCLGRWAEWMSHDDRDLGAKSQAGIQSGRDDDDDDDEEGYDVDAVSEAAIARAAREIAMATDAMILSLLRHHRAAIYRRCNVASVWHFPHMDFTVTLPEAEKELTEKLSKNIATKVFF